MRHFSCLLLAIFVSAVALRGQAQSALSPIEQEVLKASQARLEAINRRDMETLARYIADDCILSSDDGTLMTKTQYMHIGKLPFAYDYVTNPREAVVHAYGDTAVVNFRITGHEQFGDADIVSEQRRTETWIKRKGSWVLIASQWDNIPVNFRKSTHADPKTLQDYVGQYRSRPGDDIETVFVKDGRLWSRVGEDVAEYLPSGGDSFFLREGDLATFTFWRDAQGHVTGYIYHRIDGQQFLVKKIK
ncbi:MAG TPA: DUF4440 domain-containing protein [Candidatus Acidoferrales bacterium]|nr:DUF4440 domain-containing protein [Candidatus Acidoferrales bacterium]